MEPSSASSPAGSKADANAGDLRLEALRALDAFADVPDECRTALASIACRRTFAREREIFVQGAASESMHILLNGRAKACRLLPSGRSAILCMFAPGDLMGAPGALGNRVCDFSVVALTAVTTLEIGRRNLLGLLQARPTLTADLLPLLTRRLVECSNCLVELAHYRIEVRLATLLVGLDRSVGVDDAKGRRIPVRLSRQELADMVGTTIETCIRVMSRWQKLGWVETSDQGFTLRQPAALQHLAAN